MSGTVIVKSNTIGKRMIHVVHLKTDQCMNPQVYIDFCVGVLTPLSAIFQLYHICKGTSFSGGESRKITDPGQATGKLYHLWLRIECTLFCNLQSWARTHAVLVMGLYELLDPTT